MWYVWYSFRFAEIHSNRHNTKWRPRYHVVVFNINLSHLIIILHFQRPLDHYRLGTMGKAKACPVCGSNKWRKDAISGNAACEEGHVFQVGLGLRGLCGR